MGAPVPASAVLEETENSVEVEEGEGGEGGSDEGEGLEKEATAGEAASRSGLHVAQG
jgi:hypothetical protein